MKLPEHQPKLFIPVSDKDHSRGTAAGVDTQQAPGQLLRERPGKEFRPVIAGRATMDVIHERFPL